MAPSRVEVNLVYVLVAHVRLVDIGLIPRNPLGSTVSLGKILNTVQSSSVKLVGERPDKMVPVK